MNSRSTWIWFGLAVGLFLFIVLFERHWSKPQPEAGSAAPLLMGFQPEAVTALTIQRSNQVVQLQRDGQIWRLLAPVRYPANPVMVQNLFEHLSRIDRRTFIRTEQWADFGLAPPAAVIIGQQSTQRWELQIGALTPLGDQVYVRNPAVEGVYTAELALWQKALPENPHDWRSHALLAAPTPFTFDRFEVRSTMRGLGFALLYQATNRTWRLGKPMQARANQTRANQMVLAALESRIARFVTDDPAADPERFGCAPPDLELVLGSGTNDLLTVQFGASPTNEPALVYARCLAHTNVVLVPRALIETLRTPYAELRDRHLFNFDPVTLQSIEVAGHQPFLLQRQSDGQWRVVQPEELTADPVLVKELISGLYTWEVAAFEKDVVTDFAPYGLAPPWREIVLRAAVTNGATATNLLVAQVGLSTNVAGRFFARRADENSVFALEEATLYRLPQYPWELRDRHVWSYALSNVVRLIIREGNRATQLIRMDTNRWAFGAASQGLMNEFAVEEVVLRLGDLNALYWVDRGEGARQRQGFTPEGLRLDIEVKIPGADRFQTLTLEFGPPRKERYPLACVTLDGQPWIFEFPSPLYQMIMRELPLPRLPAASP